MRRVSIGLLAMVLMVAVLPMAFAGGAAEDVRDVSPDAFYSSSDTIEMIISWSAGGGTDTIGRLIAPYLSRHISGQPNVQVVNVTGGGGIEGHNEFALRRRADGSNMLFSAGSSQMAYLLNEPGIRFDFADMQPAFGVPAGAVIYANPNAGVTSVEDLLNPSEPLRFGSIGVASTDAIVLLAFDVLDLDVQTIFGYEGSGAIRIAFEQGEVNINRDGTIVISVTFFPWWTRVMQCRSLRSVRFATVKLCGIPLFRNCPRLQRFTKSFMERPRPDTAGRCSKR